jgi:hypothetical protein
MSLSVIGMAMQQLGDRQVRELVIERAAEEDDLPVEEARVDVERTLAVRGLLDSIGISGLMTRFLAAGVDTFIAPQVAPPRPLSTRSSAASGESQRGGLQVVGHPFAGNAPTTPRHTGRKGHRVITSAGLAGSTCRC